MVSSCFTINGVLVPTSQQSESAVCIHVCIYTYVYTYVYVSPSLLDFLPLQVTEVH